MSEQTVPAASEATAISNGLADPSTNVSATSESSNTAPAPTSTLTAPRPQPEANATPPTVSTLSQPVSISADPVPGAIPEEEMSAAGSTATPTALTANQDSTSAHIAPVKEEDTEPQNTLTKQFSDNEWGALKEFRAELPEIFADGFPDDPKASEKPITFWGVNIDPKAPAGDARWPRNLSVRDARDMFVSTLRWRTSIDIDAVLKEEFPQDVFGNVGHIYGRDHEGRPVVYNIYGGNNLAEVFSDTRRFIRWRVALHEKSLTMLDFTEVDQTVQIHDYLGVGLGSRDAKSKAAASEATNIFQSHYPELLHKKFFVNVPTIMNWIFWAFKPLLPAATLAKMSVVGTGHHALQKALLPIIDAKELPKQYGGEADGW
ncbi:hypothetical protein H0H92_000955 [Tricholoma furcatifolium]|nr:hypothetical protein H0H92_000955 [Tricholoma furcatifolium]